jgi:hypothetical protein
VDAVEIKNLPLWEIFQILDVLVMVEMEEIRVFFLQEELEDQVVLEHLLPLIHFLVEMVVMVVMELLLVVLTLRMFLDLLLVLVGPAAAVAAVAVPVDLVMLDVVDPQEIQDLLDVQEHQDLVVVQVLKQHPE